MRRLACQSILLLAVLAPLRAQIPTPAGQANWSVDAHADWRVHLGDDPAWAAPTFDDSHWQAIDLHNQRKLDTPSFTGNARWFRTRLHLPAQGPVDLFLTGVYGTFEVYVDGRLVGSPIRSTLARGHKPIVVSVRNDATGPVEVVLAIRSHYYRSEFFSAPDLQTATIGSPAAIQTAATAYVDRTMLNETPNVAVFTLAFFLGLALIALFLQQKSNREYLWLGLALIFSAFTSGLVDAVSAGLIPSSVNAFLGDPSTYLGVVAEIEFVFAFTGRRISRIIRVYQASLVVFALVGDFIWWNVPIPIGYFDWIENGLTLPGMILAVVILIILYRRGNREAGLLILPVILFNAAQFLFDVDDLLSDFRSKYVFNFEIHIGPLSFDYPAIGQLLFLFVIGIVLFRRFTRVTREQALAQSELESARTIQQVLIPEALPNIPNLRIESVYHPAQQVGGDFFQIIPLGDSETREGTLVVIGDVSGKGLPAAMNVALIVGTLRTLAEQTSSPAQILAGLNRRMLGRSTGFTTCLVLNILPTGHVTLANAGHLNPYLAQNEAGTELDIANGLPLGLSADATYSETTLSLAPHQTLTLITDGVVEATKPHTRDLFGFDRTRAISHLTAQEIANTAQTFGQEDDIAVLTLTFNPAS